MNKYPNITVFFLFLILLSLGGCCTTEKKKKSGKRRDPAFRDKIVRLYLEELEDDEALKSGDNRYIEWEKRKNMFKYSVKKAAVRIDYEKEDARKNQYYKKAMRHTMSNNLKKTLSELKKANNSLSNNKYIKKIYKAVEMRHLKNLAFNNQEMQRATSGLINGRYSQATRNADIVLSNSSNKKNVFLIREAYKTKYTAAVLNKNTKLAQGAYKKYKELDKKIRKKYYEGN